ncbi:MAG: HlyD family efflux transporter periplasmic adaptor subunit [Crocinitomicaceae bacterium]|nr:HlyD family efflux transporter periplasmic adaptor subunit [Crocinitomicaceae bacterium]
MKRSQLILLAIFVVISGVIYLALANNKKELVKELKPEEKTVYVPIREVQNRMRRVTMESYGQVNPNAEINISFEVQGKLNRGAVTMKPGIKFRKGQLLYRLNNSDAQYNLKARKSALTTIIVASLPDIELDFPQEREKWVKFLNGLNPNAKSLPEFPTTNSEKESLFIVGRNILTEYYTLKSLEEQLKKYSYYAPFSGTVISVNAEPGTIASPGMMIARIAKTGDFEVKIPIAMEDLDMFKNQKSADFKDSKGRFIGTGKIIRISDVVNQQTQSVDVYYSIKAEKGKQIYNGMFLTVTIPEEETKNVMAIPRAAMDNGKVTLLEGDKMIKREVHQVGEVPDSLFVTNLEDGEQLVLEKLEKVDPKKTYIGIKR